MQKRGRRQEGGAGAMLALVDPRARALSVPAPSSSSTAASFSSRTQKLHTQAAALKRRRKKKRRTHWLSGLRCARSMSGIVVSCQGLGLWGFFVCLLPAFAGLHLGREGNAYLAKGFWRVAVRLDILNCILFIFKAYIQENIGLLPSHVQQRMEVSPVFSLALFSWLSGLPYL